MPLASLACPVSDVVTSALPVLDKNLFPKIQFWTYAAFKAWKKPNKKPNQVGDADPEQNEGERISMLWLENEHGEIIEGSRLDQIRSATKRIWNIIYQSGCAPPV